MIIPGQAKNKILSHIKHCDKRINRGIPHYDECEDFNGKFSHKGDKYEVSVNISRTVSICRNGETLYQGPYIMLGGML